MIIIRSISAVNPVHVITEVIIPFQGAAAAHVCVAIKFYTKRQMYILVIESAPISPLIERMNSREPFHLHVCAFLQTSLSTYLSRAHEKLKDIWMNKNESKTEGVWLRKAKTKYPNVVSLSKRS